MASAHDQDNYNTGGYIAFIGSMVFTILFFIWVSFIHKGVDLKEVAPDHPANEAPAAAPAAPAPAPGEAKPGAGNAQPQEQLWAASEALEQRGRELFTTMCASCHGADGKGKGPAARGFQPRDLVVGQWKNGGDSASLFSTISTGIAGTAMASFGHLPIEDRWALVHFIRAITKNVVADNQSPITRDR